MSVSAVVELRAALATRFPGVLPLAYRTTEVVTTGLAALDALLPGGGLPRGRMTVWAPGGGATAVLRATCQGVIARGERAAWIDAGGMVVGEIWPRGLLLFRPPGELEALTEVEELLRCGGFALVVLTGVGKEMGVEGVRLSRAVREGGGVFAVLATGVPLAQLRLWSRLRVEGYRWRLDPFGEPVEVETVRMQIRAAALGWSGRTELDLPVIQAQRRLALDPLLVDRRGVRKGNWRWRKGEGESAGVGKERGRAAVTHLAGEGKELRAG